MHPDRFCELLDMVPVFYAGYTEMRGAWRERGP